jgi:dihydropteridine reductase
MQGIKRSIIIGGNGALGNAVVEVFKDTWEVTSVDFKPNALAHSSLVLPVGNTDLQHSYCVQNLSGKYDALICVAGGWTGGSISSSEIFDQTRKMIEINLYPSLLASHLATSYLSDYGLVILTGSAVVFKDVTPGNLAYGLAKTAVHCLALNLATRESIPSNSSVNTILPEVIDTPSNRLAMPNADFSTWCEPKAIAGLIKMWADGNNRPQNGSFAVLKKIDGNVIPEFV